MRYLPWALLLVLNLLAFIAFAYDKLAALRSWRRISEARLMRLTAIGGVLGAIAGMKLCHHKVSKRSFLWRLLPAGLLGAIVDSALVWWGLSG